MVLIISVLAAFHTALELEYRHPSTAAAKHSGARPERQHRFENGSGAVTRQRHIYKYQQDERTGQSSFGHAVGVRLERVWR